MVTFGLSGSLQVAGLLIGGLPLEFFQKLDCLFIDHSCELVATDGCPEELCDKRLQPHCRWTQCVISLPFATQPLLLHFHRKTSAFPPPDPCGYAHNRAAKAYGRSARQIDSHCP